MNESQFCMIFCLNKEGLLPKKQMTMICKFNSKLEYKTKIGKLSITRFVGFVSSSTCVRNSAGIIRNYF